jgi:mannose-6-phosphate isomerase-like protein (cupin superfamily)
VYTGPCLGIRETITTMTTYVHRALPAGLAFLAGPQPPDKLCFRSDRLQIRWTDSDTPWTDPGQHLHRDSDEVYIVLDGVIVLDIEDEQLRVSAGEVCFVPAGVFHAVVAVETPIRNLVIRSPAGSDKTYRET